MKEKYLPAYTKVTILLFSDFGAQADITPFIAGTDQPCNVNFKCHKLRDLTNEHVCASTRDPWAISFT